MSVSELDMNSLHEPCDGRIQSINARVSWKGDNVGTGPATGQRTRAGFSLLECTVSVLLVGILLTTSLRSLSTNHVRNSRSLELMQAKQLCEAMCREVLSQSFAEPVNSVSSLGTDVGENPSLRSDWDDVDDYADLNITPPTDVRGQPLSGFNGWRVAVAVRWADPNTLLPTQTSTTVKRIDVQVVNALNRVVFSETVYRTAAEY